MAEVTGSKTGQNLWEAFAGESQANRKYLAFAKKADQEGHSQIAKLFRAAAAAETVHAHYHLRTVGAIGSTADNLKEAISGETHEFTAMYPEMIRVAKSEGFEAARRGFEWANRVEEVHAGLYSKALENLGANPEVDYWVCQVCGHTLEEAPSAPCAVCGAAVGAFQRVD